MHDLWKHQIVRTICYIIKDLETRMYYAVVSIQWKLQNFVLLQDSQMISKWNTRVNC